MPQISKRQKRGQEAYNVRIALGSLIIKERLGLSDEETVNQITENTYLQYFLGFESYIEKQPEDMLNRINETIIKHGSTNDEGDDDEGTSQGNSSNEETKEIETEGTTLKDEVERYKNRNGFYPEVVLADKIYRKNREYCKGNNIRLSGPSLGRKTEKIKKEEQKLEYLDNCNRNQVEGKFGEGKRKYSLGKIMTKLAETSATTIVLSLIVMNLEKKLRLLLCLFIKCFETIKIGVGAIHYLDF